MRYTQDTFRIAYSKKHPELDFSKAVYVDKLTPVLIGCSIHGFSEQKPVALIKGRGCKLCAKRGIKKTHEQFMAMIGDNYPHIDFSKSKYISCKDKITATCKYHGEFEKRANDFKYGKSCPKCGDDSSRMNNRVQRGAIYSRLKSKHPAINFDYESISFYKSKIKAECLIHGVFQGTPKTMMQNTHGCPKCAKESQKIS